MNKKLYISLFLVLLLSVSAIARDEESVIFKQYKQETVKPYDYSYNDSFMNFMMFPYPFGRYIGYDYLYDIEQDNNYNKYLLKDMPENTLVNPNEYPVSLQENL